MTDIAIINRSSLDDSHLAAVVESIQLQVTRDFAPFWGKSAQLHFFGTEDAPPPASANMWPVLVLNAADDSDDLGYHEDTDGTPSARVFVEDDLAADASTSVTLSHEILELLADPTAALTATRYSLEVCDPVESDADGYEIDGILVSNFVTPAYFNLNSSSRYDFMQRLAAPVPALLAGGYLTYFAYGQWLTQAARFRDGSISHRAAKPHGRTALRVRTSPHGVQLTAEERSQLHVDPPAPKQDASTSSSTTPAKKKA